MDFNKYQIDGKICDIKDMDPFSQRWESFGWRVLEVDGHDIKQLSSALERAEKVKARPSVIVAHTIKGKGVSFIEEDNRWHGVAPKPDELTRALEELK